MSNLLGIETSNQQENIYSPEIQKHLKELGVVNSSQVNFTEEVVSEGIVVLPLNLLFEDPQLALEGLYESADQSEHEQATAEVVEALLHKTPLGRLSPFVREYLRLPLRAFIQNPQLVCPHALERHSHTALTAAQNLANELEYANTYGYITMALGNRLTHADIHHESFPRLVLVGEEIDLGSAFLPNSYLQYLEVIKAKNLEVLGDLTDIDFSLLLMVCSYLGFESKDLFFAKSSKEKTIGEFPISPASLSETIRLLCHTYGINRAKLTHGYTEIKNIIDTSKSKLTGYHYEVDQIIDFDWDNHTKAIVLLDEIMGLKMHINPDGSIVHVKSNPVAVYASALESIMRINPTNFNLSVELAALASEDPLFYNTLITVYNQISLVSTE